MQPKTRAVIALDALGLAALAALFVLWCVRTPNLTAAGDIAAGCSAALFAAVGLRFVPAWVRFWQREDAAPAVPAQEPEHMAARIFAALLALDLALLVLTWGVRALAGQPETITQALEFWRCLDSRHYLDIARDGYIAAGDPDRVVQLVFLPGYPLAVRTVMLLVPSDICAGLLLVPLGFAAYCYINWRVAGNPLQFLIYQREHWNQRTGLFFSTAAYQTDYLLRCLRSGNWRDALGLWLPNLIACFSALILLAKTAPRLRASQTAWFLAYYIIAVGATWLLSAPRYLLVLLPVPLALAQCAQKRTADRILTALSALAALGYLAAFALRWQVW